MAQQFDARASSRFFMRVNFSCEAGGIDVAALRAAFAPIVERFGLTWTCVGRSRCGAS